MIKIALFTGGTDSEREISLRSAKNVEQILNKQYTVAVFDYPKNWNDFLLKYKDYSVAVPVIHGKGGEDGEIQRKLDDINIPYLFSKPYVHANAYNKYSTKQSVKSAGIKVPAGIKLWKGESCTFPVPAVVKPSESGSSVGVTIVRKLDDYSKALELAFQHSHSVIVEEYIDGQEFTVGIVEIDGKNIALPVIMIKPKSGFFDFASKYNKETLADEICPAPISIELTEKLQQIALKAHDAMGVKQLSRSDFMVNKDGEIYFLEINTIPGMTNTSLIPKALKTAGYDIEKVFAGWVESVK